MFPPWTPFFWIVHFDDRAAAIAAVVEECRRGNLPVSPFPFPRAAGDHAARRPATTMTLLGACLRTKSTVSLKTPRPLPPRGAPMTMISLWRRFASSTIARPAWRALTIPL